MKQKTAKCKQCKAKHVANEFGGFDMYQPPNSLGRFCNTECAADWLKANKDKVPMLKSKAYDAETQELKVKFGLKKKSDRDRPKAEQAASKACHTYIRARDKGDLCICCNKVIKTVHAGHFKSADKYSILKYDEDNIHAQDSQCNMYNGGDSGMYEYKLRKKIGDERVNALYEKIEGSSNVYRHTIEELEEIERYYKDKLKQLNKNN